MSVLAILPVMKPIQMPLSPLLPHTGWLVNCFSLDTPPPISCGSNSWVATPTPHSSPMNWCACEHIPLSRSLAASPTTFLPISSDISLAVNNDLRHRPNKGAAMLVLLPPLPVTPSGWLLSKIIIILRLLSVSACHPPNQWRLWMLLSTRKQKFSQLTLANSTKERNLHYCLVTGFTQALQMAIPMDRTQANQTTPSTLPCSNSSRSNQQNYWLRLSPMSVMHITLRWKLKKERKELRSIVSYDNNMIHDLWFVVLLWKSIVCTVALDRTISYCLSIVCTIIDGFSCMVPPYVDW
jgi:hypothetical protein